jgi:hypothetical protein
MFKQTSRLQVTAQPATPQKTPKTQTHTPNYCPVAAHKLDKNMSAPTQKLNKNYRKNIQKSPTQPPVYTAKPQFFSGSNRF